MKKFLSLTFLPALLVACAASEPMTYDQDSWQTIISEDCESYFDGCNNCNRAAGSEVAACTRKFCPEYEEPRCLDEEN